MVAASITAAEWRDELRKLYPTLPELPFCSALLAGRFDRPAILRAEKVELYRAVNTRSMLHNEYRRKAAFACESGTISRLDVIAIDELLSDEGETEDHIDHVDMRYKLFAGTPVRSGVLPTFDPIVGAINSEWIAICMEADLFTLIAIMASIEDWYAPMSAFFEREYRSRGFTDEELELFVVHKDADIHHATAQFELLERGQPDIERTLAMVRRTFVTSRGYDASKLRLAESAVDLGGLFDLATPNQD